MNTDNTASNINTLHKNNNTSFNATINLKKTLVSPYGATIFPLFLLIIALLFPPGLYKYYVGESDFIFININVLFFVALCIIYYYIGIFIANYKSEFNINLYHKKIIISPFTYIGLISFITIILQAIFIIVYYYYFIRFTGLNVFSISLSGAGQLIKQSIYQLHMPFGLGGIPTVIIAFEFWLIYQMYDLNNKIKGMYRKRYKYLKISIYVSIILFITENIILVNRPAVITFIIGWFILYIHFNKRKIFYKLIFLLFIIMAIFIVTSLLRWSNGDKDVIFMILGKFLGYTVATFNRLALILNGKLNYVNAGVPSLYYILPIMKIPLTRIVFYHHTEIASITLSAAGDAGLNSSYNMATLFGGVYQSIGVVAPIYFAVLGFIGGRIFHSFERKKTFGLIMYPLFYVSTALFTIGVNFYFMNFLYYFYAFLALALYNVIFKQKDYANG